MKQVSWLLSLIFYFINTSYAYALIDDHQILFNDREGKSNLISKQDEKKIQNIQNLYSKEKLIQIFKDSIEEVLKKSPQKKICPENLMVEIKNSGLKSHVTTDYLKFLRKFNFIDDIVLKQLELYYSIEPINDQSSGPLGKFKEIENFLLQIRQGQCAQDSFKSLMVEYKNNSFDARAIKENLSEALNEEILTEKTYKILKKLLKAKYHLKEQTLSNYLDKKKFLRNQFPIIANEYSLYSQTKIKKSSIREKLYLQYSPIQISLMANIIKKLKVRLESNHIDIIIYQSSEDDQEVITLDPMERFRFSIRALRKDMEELKLSSYFNGIKPSYKDIMMAAYEVGHVSNLELDEILSLEEIWNPKKTLWEKAQLWIRLCSTVASVALPPPYGFIPALILVAIEAATSDQDNDNFEHGLF